MRVVDTSVWIELIEQSQLALRLRSEVPVRSRIMVPTIVQLELLKWMARELSPVESDRLLAYTQKCIVIGLDTLIAMRAAESCRKWKLATADAVIYASALQYGADLLTCDAHFKGLPSVIYIAK